MREHLETRAVEMARRLSSDGAITENQILDLARCYDKFIATLEAQLAEQRERAEKAESERDALCKAADSLEADKEYNAEVAEHWQTKWRAAEESLREAEARAIEHAANLGIERALRKEANERCARLRDVLGSGQRMKTHDLAMTESWVIDDVDEVRAALEAAEAAAPAEGSTHGNDPWRPPHVTTGTSQKPAAGKAAEAAEGE